MTIVKKHTPIFYFAVLSILASGFNYLTYPLLGRILSDEQFINVAVALSLLTQISTVLLSIIALTIGLTKEKSDGQKVIEHLQAVVIKLFLVLIGIFTVFSPLLFQSISLPPVFVVPVALLLLFSVPSSVFSGYLNGRKQLIKVGLVSLITSSFQFILTIVVGLLFTSGLLSLLAMATGQLLAIFFIIRLFKKEKLPRVTLLKKYLSKKESSTYRPLFYYAVYASLGILAINILQVLDLLVITSNKTDAVIYTDIYVISRAVYFAGIIFVWPYLSSVDLHQTRKNIKPTLRLISFSLLLSVVSGALMWFFGDNILNLAMGTSYSLGDIRTLAMFAISYKFFWLGILSIVLYFTVIRSYFAFFIPLAISIVTGVYMVTFGSSDSSETIIGLNVVALLGFILSLTAFRISLRSPSKTVYTTSEGKEFRNKS
jgi:O-antigen/teichoic acid export membrane protein